MPRVHFVKAARKDNPAVRAGEPYYWWKFRYGGKRYSRTRPRPSQLTQSEHLSTMYAICEHIEDLSVLDLQGEPGLLENLAEDVRELGNQAQESLDNMPESLQYSPTGEMLQERVDECESFANELEGIEVPDLVEEPDSEPEEPDAPKREDYSHEDDYKEARERWEEEHDEWEHEFEEWEEASEAYEVYEQDLQNALDQAQGLYYEGP